MTSSDEDDDKPLGASLSRSPPSHRHHGKHDEPSDRDIDSDDRSSSDKRRHGGHSYSRKRGTEDIEDTRSWKRTREEPLFADSGKSGMDRKLERAVAEITLDMMEAVRLGQTQLLTILEHPKAEDFIIGAYVRYPDLEKVEADGVPPEEAPFLPAQITKIVPLETPEKVITKNGTESCTHQMTIVQYTQRFDHSLKIRKSKLNVNYVSNEPFEMRELEQWRELLKLFSGRAGAEKLQTLPQMLPETAERLRSFTFTAEDVKAILSAGSSLNWRDLYLKKAELEFQIEELQVSLDNAAELSEEALDDTTSRLEAAQAELAQVKQDLEFLRKEESTKKDPPRAEQDAIPVVPAAINRARLRAPGSSGGTDLSMLTPRFLQTKSTTGGASRVLDWRSLEGAHHYTRVAWSNPAVKADSLYKPAHVASYQEWKNYKRRLAEKVRNPETMEHLKKLANEIINSNIDFEANVHRETLGRLQGLFSLPFTCPTVKGDREIVNLLTKAEE